MRRGIAHMLRTIRLVLKTSWVPRFVGEETDWAIVVGVGAPPACWAGGGIDAKWRSTEAITAGTRSV